MGVRAVIVENGTLPDNVLYTSALLAAIDRYGTKHELSKYVLWRDHDLMWWSESSSSAYGPAPYDHVRRPIDSPFIQFAVQHDDARRELTTWAPDLHDVTILPNTFDFTTPPRMRSVEYRSELGIPQDDFVIARTTRIIPQKRIDRDIHLVAAVNAELDRLADPRTAHLVAAGDTNECPREHSALANLAEELGVELSVHFVGMLPPRIDGDSPPRMSSPSVRDLISAADLVSFLTSYDYESFGNPIGEAIAAGVPYLTTRYQLYDAVYGSKGFEAPVMELKDPESTVPPPDFVQHVVDLLLDKDERQRIAHANRTLGRSHLASIDQTVGTLLTVKPLVAPLQGVP